MSGELKTDRTEGREMLRELLTRLQNEAQQRIKDLRKDQEQERELEPEDEMESARATAELETHAGLIARAEEKLRLSLLKTWSGLYSFANLDGLA